MVDSLRNVNKIASLEKIEVYGKLLGSPRTEKVVVSEQTKMCQQFFRQHATTAPYQLFTKILRLYQKKENLRAD